MNSNERQRLSAIINGPQPGARCIEIFELPDGTWGASVKWPDAPPEIGKAADALRALCQKIYAP